MINAARKYTTFASDLRVRGGGTWSFANSVANSVANMGNQSTL